MPLTSIPQDDFSSGLYSGRKAPNNAVYDLVNGLINDEGLIYRRGGSTYYSASDAPETPRWVDSLYMRGPAATRVLLASPNKITALNGSLNPVDVMNATAESQVPFTQWSRPAVIGDVALFAVGPTTGSFGAHVIFYYGGSLKANKYNTGTWTGTAGNPVITGTGTSWLANVDPGMVFATLTGFKPITVKSVDSNTQVTLASPPAESVVGGFYAFENGGLLPSYSLPPISGRSFVAAAGSGTSRLMFGIGNRVYFSERGTATLNQADYHELPANATITGMEGRGDSVWVFTTAGVWAISNLSFDAIDANGNIQHVVEQANKDVILWDDYGIAGYAGGLVIPCIDDVFIAGPDFSLTALTGRIRPLYRSYVKAGYQPGQAAVHRGHYILPILNGTTVVDVLVCRLDRDAAWTRWAGGAACAGYTTLISEASRSPKLLGLKGSRVTNLTGCFDSETSSTDADGTASDFILTTRDYPTGANQPGVVNKLRARYELEGDATVTPAFSSDQDDGTYTSLARKGEQGGAAGWSESDGSKYQWADVGKKRDRIRFKLTVAGASARFVLRSLELLIRPSGKL